MNRRVLLIVAIALVVLSLLAIFGNRPATRTEPQSATLLPGLRPELDAIEDVEIRTAGDEVAVTLRRLDERWVVDERDDYPAEFSKIRDGLDALADAKIIELKTANPALHDRLGVEDIDSPTATGISVSIHGDGIDVPVVILGETEGSNYRYARLANSEQSVLIDKNPDLPKSPAQWLVPQILDVRGPRIDRVTISHADGETLEIFKSEVGQSNYEVANIPQGRELQYPGVANVIGNSLRDLRLEDVASVQPDSGEPEVVTVFRTFDGLIVRAEGRHIDDADWLTFEASVDPDRPTPQSDDADSEAGTADETTAGTASDSSPDPVADAEHINDTVRGWRYKLASYQYDQITRRMADLLSAQTKTDSDDQ